MLSRYLSRDVPRRARVIKPRAVRFADGTEPEAHRCHENVDRWVSEGRRRIAVRGWLVSSWNEYGGVFDAHSVVKEGLSMFDITPLRASLKFISHRGSEENFLTLRARQAQFVYTPIG